jgi:hypothetical protein
MESITEEKQELLRALEMDVAVDVKEECTVRNDR